MGTIGNHTWIQMFTFVFLLYFLPLTLHTYPQKQPPSLAVRKFSQHLIIYDIRKKQSSLPSLCILQPFPQAHTLHLTGLKRHNGAISQEILKHLPFLEPHFPIPCITSLGEIVYCGKLDQSWEYKGIAHCNKPIHSSCISHLREGISGTDTQSCHGEHSCDSCKERKLIFRFIL